MHIKRFEATTMLEAVRKVKEELGPDALVLSTRSVRKHGGPFGLFGRPLVEVTAAVDRDLRRGGRERGDGETAVDSSWQDLRVSKALVDPLEQQLRELRRAVDGLGGPRAELDDFRRELGGLRRVTADLVRGGAPASMDPLGARLSGRLLAAGVASRHAHRLGEEAAACEAAGSASGDLVLRRALASRLDARLVPPREDDSARVELFVGPTGVGKTTTLAKIAAWGEGSRGGVSLVTTDSFRIGAEEQLRTFANFLHVPFGVAVSAEDLAQRVGGLGRSRVLVDTAGRSRREQGRLPELRAFRERLGSRARMHLVLSATTKDVDLLQEIEHYAPLRPDSLIVTKLDESADLGNVANLLLDDQAPPLAWIGTGQRVPEDLEVPDPQSLAEQILGAAA